MYAVYILKSESSDHFYIGQTIDIANRLQHHNQGLSRWTRRHLPWRIVYKECYSTRTEAIKRERQLKAWKNKGRIVQLINKNGPVV